MFLRDVWHDEDQRVEWEAGDAVYILGLAPPWANQTGTWLENAPMLEQGTLREEAE